MRNVPGESLSVHPHLRDQASLFRPVQVAKRIHGRCSLASAMPLPALAGIKPLKSDGLTCLDRLGVARWKADAAKGRADDRTVLARMPESAALGSLGRASLFPAIAGIRAALRGNVPA